MANQNPPGNTRRRARARRLPTLDQRFPPSSYGEAADILSRVGAPTDEISRRELLSLMGASIALAGLGGCKVEQPERILPYVEQPVDVEPGLAQYYATSMVIDGFATGLLVQSREGRPIKIEGNPEHPASLGATGVFEQASVLQVYDPDRAKEVMLGGSPQTWDSFFERVAAGRQDPGRAIWFLMYPQSSPLVNALLSAVRTRYPAARFAFYSPLERNTVYAAARRSFGRALEAQYDFRRAGVVLSLGADFTSAMPMSLTWARQLADARRPSSPQSTMTRLYMVEPMPSPTGMLADHRLRIRPSEMPQIAAGIMSALLESNVRPPGVPANAALPPPSAPSDKHAAWCRAVARDLAGHRGASIVIPGDNQPIEVHLLAHLINAALGNLGTTITMTEPALLGQGDPAGASIVELAAAIEAGEVDTLVICEANPVYTAPADMELARLLERVPTTAHLSLHYNETSRACQWFLPAAHFLESWGDARAYDGTLSFMQPLIRPLYAGKSLAELLVAFAGMPELSGELLLRGFWQDRILPAAGQTAGPAPGQPTGDTGGQSDWLARIPFLLPPTGATKSLWESYLQRGLVPNSRFAPVGDQVAMDGARAWAAVMQAFTDQPGNGLELNLMPSPTLYDGRFANISWLLELPDPITKLSWDNAAVLSPRTAKSLQVDSGNVVELRLGEHAVRAPVQVMPGHADGVVSLALGYGRAGTESLARGVGVNAFALRIYLDSFSVPGLVVKKMPGRYPLAHTQEHFRLHGRELAPMATLAEYRQNPNFTAHQRGPVPSLLPERLDEVQYRPMQWAMTIDTSICTGCSACVIACQAENNIPVVGKGGVLASREMHWLRIDQYRSGSDEDPEVVNQPMLCQHCEKAPCEYPCPVNATVHSPDGLNEMVYNRCIGTRFCSNNCPYKVRRFNWFEYTDDNSPQMLQRNPEVTVRERGVMEKCTFCVQRIRRTQIQARIEGRDVAPGEIMTACQQACPTRAIQFGSLTHLDTEMVRWRKEPRAYEVLHNLGTQPRIYYLAKISHPNPELT